MCSLPFLCSDKNSACISHFHFLISFSVKVKVNLSFCLTNYALCHEGVWGVVCIDPHFLERGTSWRSVSRPGLFNPEERASGTHWTGGWVDPRADLDDVEMRKSLALPGLELQPPGRPACSQSLYRLRYSGSFNYIVNDVKISQSARLRIMYFCPSSFCIPG
jgi:hypothetical protein